MLLMKDRSGLGLDNVWLKCRRFVVDEWGPVGVSGGEMKMKMVNEEVDQSVKVKSKT